jgi:hypothetical protein
VRRAVIRGVTLSLIAFTPNFKKKLNNELNTALFETNVVVLRNNKVKGC